LQRIEKGRKILASLAGQNYMESHSGGINRKCISAVELKQEPPWLREKAEMRSTRCRRRGAIDYLLMPLSAIIWLASLTVGKRA
jgi:hypothetical protein